MTRVRTRVARRRRHAGTSLFLRFGLGFGALLVLAWAAPSALADAKTETGEAACKLACAEAKKECRDECPSGFLGKACKAGCDTTENSCKKKCKEKETD